MLVIAHAVEVVLTGYAARLALSSSHKNPAVKFPFEIFHEDVKLIIAPPSDASRQVC